MDRGELVIKPSAVPYGIDPESGASLWINTLGVIRPIRPDEVRRVESATRVECAKAIAPKILKTLSDRGIRVTEIGLTGSAASEYSGPESDIDITVAVEGLKLDKFSLDYFGACEWLGRIVSDSLGDRVSASDTGEPNFRLHVFLENDYQSPEYRRAALEGGFPT